MKGVFCQGDYLGKFNIIINSSTDSVPLSAFNTKLVSVKTPSTSLDSLEEYIPTAGTNPFATLEANSGYIVFAKEKLTLPNFKSTEYVGQLNFLGDVAGKYTIFHYPFVNSLPISAYNTHLLEVKTPSSSNSVLRTYVPTNDINPFTNFEYDCYYVVKAKSNFTITNPDPSIKAELQVGSINAGESVLGGTTLEGFVDQLIRTIFEPGFVSPSLAASIDLPSVVEVGTTGITLTASFNRGSIVGALVGDIWNIAAAQNFRAGTVSTYALSAGDIRLDNTVTLSDVVIADGTNTFMVSANYLQGPQPLNNRNEAYTLPLPADSMTATVSVTGARKAFYGIDSLGSNGIEIRALQNNTLNPKIGTTFTINIPIGTSSVVFSYPASLRDVSKVVYEEGFYTDVKENFTKTTTVWVSGLNGYHAEQYKTYRYVPIEPFGEEVNYTVTI